MRLFFLCLLLASCVGNKARDEALLPIAAEVWPHVRVNYEDGLEDAVVDLELDIVTRDIWLEHANDLSAALEAGDRTALLSVPWAAMRPWAIRGVTAAYDAGEIGPHGADLQFQRIDNFTGVMNTLRGGSAVSSARWDRNRRRPNPYVPTQSERRVLAAIHEGGAQ